VTQEEWEACTDADAMLRLLRDGKFPERKAWLFVSAVCRSTWFASADEAFSRVVWRLRSGTRKEWRRVTRSKRRVFQAGWKHAISGHALAWDAAAWAFSGSKDVHWLAECALQVYDDCIWQCRPAASLPPLHLGPAAVPQAPLRSSLADAAGAIAGPGRLR